MKYALVKNGVVVNVIKGNQEFADKIASDFDHVVQAPGVGVGFLYDGTHFIDPRPAPEKPPESDRRKAVKNLKNNLPDFETLTPAQRWQLVKKLIELI